MEPSPDELAGVADLFGALDRDELHEAFENLAARGGEEFDPGALDGAIDDARREFYLVEVDGRLAPGPAALPTLPDHGVDLPHMMDVGERDVDHGALATAAEERLRGEAARAVAEEDRERARELIDVCYEIDAWAGVDLGELRGRLDDLVE